MKAQTSGSRSKSSASSRYSVLLPSEPAGLCRFRCLKAHCTTSAVIGALTCSYHCQEWSLKGCSYLLPPQALWVQQRPEGVRPLPCPCHVHPHQGQRGPERLLSTPLRKWIHGRALVFCTYTNTSWDCFLPMCRAVVACTGYADDASS